MNIVTFDGDENESSPVNLSRPLNNADSINSDSGSNSNSATILSSTNTNTTNLTYKNQRRSLVLQQIKINNDNNDEEDEYTEWLNKPNIIHNNINATHNNDYSASSVNSLTAHLPQFKQNFSVSIKNSNGTIKRPIVQYPFKTFYQNQDYISVQDESEFFKKSNKPYNSLKVDYV